MSQETVSDTSKQHLYWGGGGLASEFMWDIVVYLKPNQQWKTIDAMWYQFDEEEEKWRGKAINIAQYR